MVVLNVETVRRAAGNAEFGLSKESGVITFARKVRFCQRLKGRHNQLLALDEALA